MLETFKDENLVTFEKNSRAVYEPKLLQDVLEKDGPLAEKLENVLQFVVLERNRLFEHEVIPFHYENENTSYRLAVSSLVERSTVVLNMFVDIIKQEENFIFPAKKKSPSLFSSYRVVENETLLLVLQDITSHGERLVKNIKEQVDDPALFCGLHQLWFCRIQDLLRYC